MDLQLNRDIEKTIRRLEKLTSTTIASSNAVLRKSAAPLVNEIKRRAPVSDAPHSRYKSGQIAVTYQPGNLRRSFRVLKFRRSPALFVGPIARGGTPDGYYAHWQEFGAPAAGIAPRPFVKPAAEVAGPVVLQLATRHLKHQLEVTAKRLGTP